MRPSDWWWDLQPFFMQERGDILNFGTVFLVLLYCLVPTVAGVLLTLFTNWLFYEQVFVDSMLSPTDVGGKLVPYVMHVALWG